MRHLGNECWREEGVGGVMVGVGWGGTGGLVDVDRNVSRHNCETFDEGRLNEKTNGIPNETT